MIGYSLVVARWNLGALDLALDAVEKVRLQLAELVRWRWHERGLCIVPYLVRVRLEFEPAGGRILHGDALRRDQDWTSL